MIIPFKNRIVDLEQPVYMYRCLNRKGFTFSIKQNGLVVGHTTNLILKNCEFIVNKAGKLKALETGIRNVHAFIKGYIGDLDNLHPYKVKLELNYNPFSVTKFTAGSMMTNIDRGDAVYFYKQKLYVQI